jgi:hypothetical protein
MQHAVAFPHHSLAVVECDWNMSEKLTEPNLAGLRQETFFRSERHVTSKVDCQPCRLQVGAWLTGQPSLVGLIRSAIQSKESRGRSVIV